MTNLHKRLDTVNQKLAALDKRTQQQGEGLRDVRQQTRPIARMLSVMTRMQQESTERITDTLKDVSQMARYTTLLVSENLKEKKALSNGGKEKRRH